MTFYPATMHAYNAGFDFGFFGQYECEYKTEIETEAYRCGCKDGLKCRPKNPKKS